MTLAARLTALLTLSLAVAPALSAPADCPDRSFDYVAGGWVGQQYVVEEEGSRTFVGTTVWTARPILGGCAFEERVFVHGTEGEHIFTARLLRSWNADEERWDLTEVDDRGVHVRFVGRGTPSGAWGFEVPRVRDEREYVLRLVWERVAEGHVRETFERSFDGGETFVLASTIDFHRSPGLAER